MSQQTNSAPVFGRPFGGIFPFNSSIRAFAPLRLCVSLPPCRNLRGFTVTAFRSFLFVTLFATCLVARAEDRVQAEFDRVAKMSLAEQQAWLQQLEQRAARAARLTLSPEEAARQQAHTRSLLHQKMATWKALREVIEDADAREKAATAAVAKPQAVKTAEAAKPQAVKMGTAKPQAAIVAKPQTVKTTDTAAAPTDKLPPGSVKVNVEELEARIAASNLALRELEAELGEKGVWNAAKLEPLVERLKVLVVRHNDLGLFRDAAPKEQQADMTKLEAPKSAISQLSARVVEARSRANDPQFVGDDVERRAELARLEAISHHLAELAGK